jgi:glutamyl-tRNA synthetase
MLRFASSPTRDMNIGDLRIALFNYITSQQKNEALIVRIEDMDKEKNIEGKDKEMFDLLDLFGIEFTQTIYQSEGSRFHSAMALQLIHDKKAFSCFCSDEWIEKKRKEAEEQNKEYRYDDACRNLPAELVIDNTNPFTIRINKPASPILIRDKIKGDLIFETDSIDSFIIMNQHKIPTQNFACAVDDMLNDISIVIRSENFIENAPKQEHIRSLLNYDKKIEYAHIPQILVQDNETELPSVKALLEDGFLPEAITIYLIGVGNDISKELFTLKEAIEWFDFDKLSKNTLYFDLEKLKEINRNYLLHLDAKELSRYVGFADESIGNLAKIYLKDLSTTQELRENITKIFSPKKIVGERKKSTIVLQECIKNAPYFESYEDFKSYIVKELSLKEEDMLLLLRLVLTGKEDGPEISEIYNYIKNYLGEIIK